MERIFSQPPSREFEDLPQFFGCDFILGLRDASIRGHAAAVYGFDDLRYAVQPSNQTLRELVGQINSGCFVHGASISCCCPAQFPSANSRNTLSSVSSQSLAAILMATCLLPMICMSLSLPAFNSE